MTAADMPVGSLVSIQPSRTVAKTMPIAEQHRPNLWVIAGEQLHYQAGNHLALDLCSLSEQLSKQLAAGQSA
jgi:hypothetical protein